MLDIIRSNAQSFLVKVAFCVIILVFVFWGIGNLTDRGYVNVLATVNDEPITLQQFEEIYRVTEQAVVRKQGGSRSALSAEDKTQLGRQVFQQLVSELMIAQEARRIGLAVSPYELRLYIGDLDIFHGADGKFNPDTYKNILASRRQTPAAFEADVSRRLIHDKMVSFVSSGSWADGIEARNRYNFLRQRRTMEYIYLPSGSELCAAADPADDQIEKYYEEHKMNYVIPQKADVQYIVVDPLKTVSPDSISDESAKAYYDRNQGRFTEPESALISHILVPVDEKASDDEVKAAMDKILKIKQEIADGKTFAAAADEYNGPNAAGEGGSLGWVAAGVTVSEFDQAAFAAKLNVVTDPVRTVFGLHIILVEDKKPESVKEFDQVKAEIKSVLAAEEGKTGLNDLLDNLAEDNILGRDFDEMARARGLTAEKTGLITREEIEKKLGIKSDVAGAIMNTGVNQPVDIPLEAGDTYIVVRVAASEPSSFEPLAQVRDSVVASIRTENGLAKGRDVLEGVLKTAISGSLDEEWSARVKKSLPVDRGASLGSFKPQDDLDRAMFIAEPGSWLPSVYGVSSDEGEGVLIARVKQVMDPPDEEWQQFEGVITNITEKERVDGIVAAFMQSLLNRSKVIIRNQNVIDRVNM